MRVVQEVTLDTLRSAESIDLSMVRDFVAAQNPSQLDAVQADLDTMIQAKGSRYAKALWCDFSFERSAATL